MQLTKLLTKYKRIFIKIERARTNANACVYRQNNSFNWLVRYYCSSLDSTHFVGFRELFSSTSGFPVTTSPPTPKGRVITADIALNINTAVSTYNSANETRKTHEAFQ